MNISSSKSRIMFDPAIGWVDFSVVLDQAKKLHKGKSIVVSRAPTSYDFFVDFLGAWANNIPLYQWIREAECETKDLSGFQIVSYTSGTTGYPHEVILPIEVFKQSADVVNQYMIDANKDGAIFATLPPSSSSIISLCFLSALQQDRDLVFAKFNPYTWTETVNKFRIGHAPVVPAMLRALMQSKEFSSADSFENLQTVWMGANIIDPGSFKFWTERGVKPLTVYGSTEVPAPCLIGDVENRLNIKPDHVQYKIINDVLHIKFDAQSEFWVSNDIVKQTNQGLQIIGRTTTEFKHKDIKINPEQFESLAISVPGVTVAGLTKQHNHLVLYYQGDASIKSTVDHAVNCFAPQGIDIKIKHIESMPLNHLGKINRTELSNVS